MLGKASAPISKEEQDFIQRQVEAKRIKDEEEQKRLEKEKQSKAEKNVRDFEKLNRGEKVTQDSRNLQQIFSEFYTTLEEKRKNIDIKDTVNSAKSSMGSLSAKLEERRKKILELKQKVGENIDKDRSKEEVS